MKFIVRAVVVAAACLCAAAATQFLDAAPQPSSTAYGSKKSAVTPATQTTAGGTRFATGLITTPGFSLEAPAPMADSHYTDSVLIGDVTGDGLDDVIVASSLIPG